MLIGHGGLRRKGAASNRYVVVLVVPPVEELDLVGPIQVFSAANRLSGKPVYRVEIATNGKDLKIEGEGGLLSFLAQTNYKDLKKDFVRYCWFAALARATPAIQLFLPGCGVWLRQCAA